MKRSFAVGFMSALALVFLGIVGVPVAHAQRDAGSKIRGDYDFYSNQSSRRLSHARDYAQDVQRYVAETPKPDVQVVQEMTDEIGRNLDQAKKHLASMKKEAADDKAKVAAIEKLEKRLTTAFEHHAKVCDCFKDADFKQIKAMDCCKDLAKELDSILAEHSALMHPQGSKHQGHEYSRPRR